VAGKDEAEATVMALVESLGDKYPRSGEASEGLGGTHLGFSPKRRRSHEDEVGAGLAKMKGDIKNEERGLQEEIDTLKKEMGTAFDHITGVQLDVRTQQASAGPIVAHYPQLSVTSRRGGSGGHIPTWIGPS